jgi:hypothetical protein
MKRAFCGNLKSIGHRFCSIFANLPPDKFNFLTGSCQEIRLHAFSFPGRSRAGQNGCATIAGTNHFDKCLEICRVKFVKVTSL